MRDANGADPYTMEFHLCDADGTVRGGEMHHGTDYPCTGHAHRYGQHIRCANPIHVQGVPATSFRAVVAP